MLQGKLFQSPFRLIYTHDFRILTDILQRYDRNLVPSIKGVDVDIELLIQKVTEINEIQSSSKMDILFTQIWHDPALSFELEEGAQCVANLSLSYRMVDSIWIPNVCLVSVLNMNRIILNLPEK